MLRAKGIDVDGPWEWPEHGGSHARAGAAASAVIGGAVRGVDRRLGEEGARGAGLARLRKLEPQSTQNTQRAAGALQVQDDALDLQARPAEVE